MKRTIEYALILFLFLSACSAEAVPRRKKAAEKPAGEFDVFLLIGQSNMAGRGFLYEKDKEAMSGVFLLDSEGNVVPACEPLNQYSSIRKKISMQKMTLGGSFARDIHAATGRKVLLVVNARGGSSARQWLPGAENLKAKTGQDDLWADGEDIPVFFDEAVRRTRQAMQYGSLKGILWHQGEADAYEKYAPLWPEKVASIAENLRYELGVGKEVPFIAGETLQNFVRSDIINPYIDRIASMVPGSDFVSSEGCKSNSDNLHFSRQGITLLGHRYAGKVLQMAYGFSEEQAMKATDGVTRPQWEALEGDVPGSFHTLCDFDNRSRSFRTANTSFKVVPNPKKDDVNPSALCGCITLNGGTWDCAVCDATCPLDFEGGGHIRLKLLAPEGGESVTLKLAPAASSTCAAEMLTVPVKAGGCWEELDFDLSACSDRCNKLVKIYIMCDGGARKSGVWYFDDLRIPDDDISGQALFKRVGRIDRDRSVPWMSNSIANPEVLSPAESLDGRWWLLARGGDGSRSHNGYFTQEASTFDPLGPWTPFEGNPTMPAGWWGTEDAQQAIDPCGITIDGRFYYYYKGISTDGRNTVLIASTDDGKTFTKAPEVWKSDCGVADVVRWNGKNWLYVARRIYEYDDPLDGSSAIEHPDIIEKGGGPCNCDWYSINGGKLFRLESVGKWFLIYQAGTCNTDFPARFHAAYSDDLLHWTKVGNLQPLFTRGPRGAWDQGAIWAPSLFLHEGMLYMYYEGWGCEGRVEDRDSQYFSGGRSQIGIAACPVEDFIRWCGLE